MAKYRLTQGAKIAVSGAASPSVFADISNVESINESGDSRDQIEVTNLDSTGKDYAPGLIDYGTVEIALNYDPEETSHLTLDTLTVSGAERDWRITESGGGSPGMRTQGKGFIISRTRNRSINSVVKVTYTVKRTGAWTQI
jgi:hypothetical protein